jgi:hypothetical protein
MLKITNEREFKINDTPYHLDVLEYEARKKATGANIHRVNVNLFVLRGWLFGYLWDIEHGNPIDMVKLEDKIIKSLDKI